MAQDDRNLSAERGLSTFDQRHNLTISGVISSPFGQNATFLRSRSWVSRVLGNWNMTSSFVARSGRPLTARVLGNVADVGGTGSAGSSRADSTGLSVSDGPGYFNIAAFTIPPSGRFGNAGRNTILGPGFIGVNLSLGRTFTLSDRRRLEFRINSENATNHVNISNISTVVNASNYGLPTSAAAMRTVTMLLRLRF